MGVLGVGVSVGGALGFRRGWGGRDMARPAAAAVVIAVAVGLELGGRANLDELNHLGPSEVLAEFWGPRDEVELGRKGWRGRSTPI